MWPTCAKHAKLIIVSARPKCNGSELKKREQHFYLSAFSSLMKTHMQTKPTQCKEAIVILLLLLLLLLITLYLKLENIYNAL